MRKHTFGRGKEGTKQSNARFVDYVSKGVIGLLIVFVVAMAYVAPKAEAMPIKADAEPWQTKLTLAETTPELLVNPEPEIKIEKVVSRYEEQERQRQQEERKKAELAQKQAMQAIATDVSQDQKWALAEKAAAQYGIPTQLLWAVWRVESGFRWYFCGGSSAGARGPAQFMAGTWRGYGVDGNGDGKKDICHAEDAIPAAARYLAANGAAQGDFQRALLRYNNAQWYVDKVRAWAGV